MNTHAKTTEYARMGVDIGGTFTDVVLYYKTQIYSTKILTTYGAPENAIIKGVQETCVKAGIDTSAITQIIHGTTLATNALIERKGAKTAFITTQGFRDVIEMRTESRFDQYDLNLVLPPPLLAREHRYTLCERIGAKGNVLIAPAQEDMESLADTIAKQEYESIAIGFLHAYTNGAHEKKLAQIFAKKYPHMMVSLSCEVSAQMREYERFNTVISNAYIKPLIKTYLTRLRAKLSDNAINCPVFLIHSGGGIIALESAAEFPVRLVESGPAGGAVFAASIAKCYGLNNVISFDMGGTTAKICLINNYAPKTSRVFEVARSYRFKKGSGMPISIPVIDMVEIGAGGGSLASVDNMNQIRVGPYSAGSEPGPACYGRGGTQASVSDADLMLGKLDPDNFASGAIKLDMKCAQVSLEKCGAPLSLDAQMTAYGIVEMVDENMANAARVHAIENGENLADYTMIAFGGAAPLHAGRLCEKLGIPRLLVPKGAGVGSAIGFLCAPFSFEAQHSFYTRLSSFNPQNAKNIIADLKEQAIQFVRQCDENADLHTHHKVFMRYVGQGWEIPIELTQKMAQTPDKQIYKKAFEDKYALLFGQNVLDMDIEITLWSVEVSTNAHTIEQYTKPVQFSKDMPYNNADLIAGTRDIFDTSLAKTIPAHIVNRSDIKPHHLVQGPAIIVEEETSTVLSHAQSARLQADGCLDIQCKAS